MDRFYKGKVVEDLLSLIDYVDHQDGPSRMRGTHPSLTSAWMTIEHDADEAGRMVRDEARHSTKELEDKRDEFSYNVRMYRGQLEMVPAGVNYNARTRTRTAWFRDHGYESD